MSDQNLRITRTHGAEEFEGSFAGIEFIHFRWMALALLAGLGIFAGLFYGSGLGFMAAAQWAVIPVLAGFIYLRVAHQGKPPGYLADLIDSLITRGHARPPRNNRLR
jgi:hypothetical protein